MRLYYYDLQPNFGDALNSWMWERLIPGLWDPNDGVRFSGIGTLIHRVMPAAKRWIVFTSGAGYGPPPAKFGQQGWDVVAVRGPLTARVLGLPPSSSVSDGALLLASLEEYAPPVERSGIIFVPHHQSEIDGDWSMACRLAGVEFVSSLCDSRRVVERIRRAKLVLADSMHAAIVADALRVPWVPLVSSPRINTFKWLDWTLSMAVPYEPVGLPAVSSKGVLRHALLDLSNERHSFSARDEQSALAHFLAQSRRSSRSGWRKRRQLGMGIQSAVQYLAETRSSERLSARSDQRRIERVATVLGQAARSDGTLSTDRVFNDRLSELIERLETLRCSRSNDGRVRRG